MLWKQKIEIYCINIKIQGEKYMGIFILFICIFIIGCVLSGFYEKYDFVDFLSFFI